MIYLLMPDKSEYEVQVITTSESVDIICKRILFYWYNKKPRIIASPLFVRDVLLLRYE